MFNFVNLNTATKVVQGFRINRAGAFQFQLESAIKGPFDFDNKAALKEGYDYLTDFTRLSIPENCEVALVYRLLDVGSELSSYIRENKFGWDDMIASATTYLYEATESRLDDARYFSLIYESLKAAGLGRNCKDFKQICIMVSCKKALNAQGLKPKSGWFW